MAQKQIRNIRRQELLKASLNIMQDFGFQEITIGMIANQAGISKGVIHHYFRSKQELLEQTIRYAHSLKAAELVQKLKTANTPSEKLWANLSVILDPKYLRHGFCRAWISFSAAASRDQRLARVEKAIHARERSNILHALRPLVPEAEAAKIVLGIKALVEGFRLRAGSLWPDFDAQSAVDQILFYLREKVPAFDQAVAACDRPELQQPWQGRP